MSTEAPNGVPASGRSRPYVIAVHGAKDGVGAATLAGNLTNSLRRLAGRRVALIESDLLGTEAGVLFELAPAKGLSGVLPELKELEADPAGAEVVEQCMSVRVLRPPAPRQRPPRSRPVRATALPHVLAGLEPHFDYLVVDTPAHVSPAAVAVLDVADLIMLVVTPESDALRCAARFLQRATRRGCASEKVLLVTGHHLTGRERTSDAVQPWGQACVASAPATDRQALVASMSTGEVMVAARPHHRLSVGTGRLARDIACSFGWDPGPRRTAEGRRGARGMRRMAPVAGRGSALGQALPLSGRLGRWLAVGGRATLRAARALRIWLQPRVARALMRIGQALARPQPNEQWTTRS